MTTTRPLTLVVAINPSASFGRSRDVGPAVVATLRALGHHVTSLTEPDFDQLLEAGRRAVAARPDALIVVGGDGMVNLGVNLVAGTKVPLGLVPSGTGNDMARTLGIPHENTEAAIGVLIAALAAPARVIDAGVVTYTDDATGQIEERWFACVLSAGFDAIVNERANEMHHPKGASRYLIALALELFRLKPIAYRVTVDDETFELDGALVSVGNAQSIGGGMRVTPDAKLDDGLFDVMLVKSLSRLAFLRIFPRVFRGEHVTDSRVRIVRGRRVRIDATDVVAYADGERFGPLPLEIVMKAGALRVLAPAAP